LTLVSEEYELRYYYGDSQDPVIDRVAFPTEAEAVMRAIRGLLQLPSRHAVEVWRGAVLVFSRSRTTH